MEEIYIAALDIGTTTIRCYIVNRRRETISYSSTKIELVYPKTGYVEINPEVLFSSIKDVIREAIYDAHLSPGQITGIGITTQRASFITWNKTTGEPFHNFITWKDLRASNLVKLWNNSITMKVVRTSAYIMYLITRAKRYLAGSVINFTNNQVTLRLFWALQNNKELQIAAKNKNAMFGTLDSWLIYKLTGGQKHVTDISSASATGMYDPFICDWSSLLSQLFKFPMDMLPRVVDNITTDFGVVHQNIFGDEIPIVCSIADQSASIYGSCCFQTGDLKITLGTGGFLDITTGKDAHASVKGVYPLIGWKYGSKMIYVAEGASNDTGSLIEWALKIDLVSKLNESSNLVSSIKDDEDLFFIPAFSGLGAPINDSDAATGFIGISPTTTKILMLRAILESIVFRLYQLVDVALEETDFSPTKVKVDGGVSQNDFICQLLADMTGLRVQRAKSSDMTIQGVISLSGAHLGLWKSQDEISNFYEIDDEFHPNVTSSKKYKLKFEKWCKAVERFKKWN